MHENCAWVTAHTAISSLSFLKLEATSLKSPQIAGFVRYGFVFAG